MSAYLDIDDVAAQSTLAMRQLAELRGEIERLRILLARYRDETPLGHQPHMIAHLVDRALGRGE